MNLIYIFICFILGSVIGGFLNICINCIPKKEPISASIKCPICGRKIKFIYHIPILSYFFLGGKCNICKGKISLRYPAVEFLNGILYIITYCTFGTNLSSVFYCIVFSILIIIAVIDFNTQEIPNGLNIILGLFALISLALPLSPNIFSRVIGIFVISIPMILISLATNGGFGGGDIKLMAVVGFMLGFKLIILAFFIAVVLGGAAGIFMLVTKRAGRKDYIAFGPFLCTGIIISVLFGNQITDWYLSMLV